MSNKTHSTETQCIILGGGINGCGIARDLSLRGIHCTLIEKNDLGCGTTAHSTRLLHGGLRYLEDLEFNLVFEALRERETLFRNAPYLSRPIPFLLPVYKSSPYGMFKMRLGMILYDFLSMGKSVPGHNKESRKNILQKFSLEGKELLGGFRYYDGQVVHAERLALVNAIEAHENGARIITHCSVKRIQFQNGYWQVTVEEKNKPTNYRSKILINATGPWVDEVINDQSAEKKVRGTKGVHLITKKISHEAIYLSSIDNRMFFVVPFGDYSLIGTTDTDYTGDLDQVYSTTEDVKYLLESVKKYMPSVKLTTKDIIGVYAGVRPLARADGATSSISRKHRIYEKDECISIVGGKLTTYRQISEEVGDIVSKKLKIKQKCETKRTPLPGAEIQITAKMFEEMQKKWKLTQKEMSMLYDLYGCRIPDLLKASNGKREKIHINYPYFAFQVEHAITKEFAKSLHDVIVRLGTKFLPFNNLYRFSIPFNDL